MLILSRKINEGILIGDNIKITVVAVEGNRVKLGITAPGKIPVIREEIVDAVKRENLSAGRIDTFKEVDFNIIKPPGEEGR